jgi:hypothetical protein
MQRNEILSNILNKVPIVISFDDIDYLPLREQFIDSKISNTICNAIINGSPVIFMPTSIKENVEYGGDFVINVYGVLPCGSKTCVILTDIPLYIDVKIPDDISEGIFMKTLTAELTEPIKAVHTSIEYTHYYPFHEFSNELCKYCRIYSKNTFDRSAVVRILNKISIDRKTKNLSPLQTASDDNGYNGTLFAKIAREYKINTCDWNRMTNYTMDNSMPNCRYTFRVKINDYKKITTKQRETYANNILAGIIDKDPTMTVMWDIETYREIQNGIPPTEYDRDFTIFMICSVYCWHYSTKPLLTVCAVHADEIACHPNVDVTILCKNEKEVLLAHAELLSKMSPEI